MCLCCREITSESHALCVARELVLRDDVAWNDGASSMTEDDATRALLLASLAAALALAAKSNAPLVGGYDTTTHT